MKTEQEYINDLTEIRSMMERSSKFLSLSGWSGVLLGIYGLAGAYLAHLIMQRAADPVLYRMSGTYLQSQTAATLLLLAVVVLAMAVGTAILLAYRKSKRIQEQFWNATARRLLFNMMVPLLTGAILIAIIISKGLMGLVLPFMLLFYGITLLNASKFTFEEIKYLGVINIILGLMAAGLPDYGLLFWAAGFGLMHVIYGFYIQFRYDKQKQ